LSSIAENFQRILDLAGQYSKDATPAMLERTAVAESLAAELEGALKEPVAAQGLDGFHLLAKAGGRQANFSPIPWVRVFSKRYAPKAEEGIYLVYLFAADGSRAYLSLNQGTSEFRSGHMRSIEDQRVLLSRAAQARSALGDLMESEAAAGSALTIDLASKNLKSRDSRIRGRGYENANILALEYQAGLIPDDDQLLSDLYGLVPLLAQLWGEVPAQAIITGIPESGQPGSPPQTPGKSSGQGRLLDSVLRRKIEVHAEDAAERHFSNLGWKVSRVGPLKLGYDLACRKENGEVLHVEVKGTRGQGGRVILTDNEVRHTREADKCGAMHALYVVSEIQVRTAKDGIHCDGGREVCKWPWEIDDQDLTVTEYSYRIPSE
jgi:MrcB-like, N-terminal domain/Domain of unknown function (DUF3883)